MLLGSRSHMKNFSLLSLALVGSVSMLAGCDGGEPSDPHDQLALVQESLEAPTGTVDATTMKSIATRFESFTKASAVIGAYNFAGSAQASCTNGSDVDLACASQGQLSGSISYEIDEMSVKNSEVSATVIVEYHEACAGDVCIDGTAIVSVHTSETSTSTSLAVSLDVTEGGASEHLFLGEDASVDQDGARVKVVVFDEEVASYVLEASVEGGAASMSVKGENGEFSCSVSEAGGECSGAASFSY